MHFRSTASTALRNSLLTLRSRRPFESCNFLFFCPPRTRPRNGPSPCADLTECQHDAVHRRLPHYTVINDSHCMLSCLLLRLPHAVHLPDVLQLGVAECQEFTPQPTPFLSLTFGAKLSSRASAQLLQTSSLSTVRFFFSIDPSTDPSLDRSIELCVVSFNVAPHKMSASSLAFFQP
jgi:hypothetical protein